MKEHHEMAKEKKQMEQELKSYESIFLKCMLVIKIKWRYQRNREMDTKKRKLSYYLKNE